MNLTFEAAILRLRSPRRDQRRHEYPGAMPELSTWGRSWGSSAKMPDEREVPPAQVDWEPLLDSIRRRLLFQLRGWDHAEIEDAAQDAAVKVMLFIRRTGSPRNLEGLVTVITRRTAIEKIRARARRSGRLSLDFAPPLASTDHERRERIELEEEAAYKVLLVREFFRRAHSPCLELLQARTAGKDFRRLAQETRVAHMALLQRWARCIRRLRAAIDKGELPWEASATGRTS